MATLFETQFTPTAAWFRKLAMEAVPGEIHSGEVMMWHDPNNTSMESFNALLAWENTLMHSWENPHIEVLPRRHESHVTETDIIEERMCYLFLAEMLKNGDL